MEPAMYRLFSLALLIFSAINAETVLGGKIGGMTLDSAGNPYFVIQNAIVPTGKTLKINEGCVFLFKPFTGLTVDGSIEVYGTKEHPVVFTTENDSKYNFNTDQPANPFDWNGIHITDKADNVLFQNFLISYSVFGLKSKFDNLSVENGVFFQNGQFHFTTNEKIQPVQEGFPFSYSIFDKSKIVTSKNNAFKKKGMPVILGVTALSCAILSGISANKYSDFRAEFNQTTDFEKQKDLQNKGTKELIKTSVFGGVSLVTIPTVIILCLNNHKRTEKKNDISITPFFYYETAGAFLTFRF
jgi:hypothetical protein